MFVEVYILAWTGQKKDKKGLTEMHFNFFTAVDLILSLAIKYLTNNFGRKATAEHRRQYQLKYISSKTSAN